MCERSRVQFSQQRSTKQMLVDYLAYMGAGNFPGDRSQSQHQTRQHIGPAGLKASVSGTSIRLDLISLMRLSLPLHVVSGFALILENGDEPYMPPQEEKNEH